MTIDRSSISQPQGVLFRPEGRASSPVKKLYSLFSRLGSAVIREHRIRRDIRHVSQFDKRLLKDIGLEPDQHIDVLRYGRDAFWRV
ncbi:DUF1127 domain-containing protein [Ruegeria arenilitoris]|uniref:DUF1127 domain-containing protein n=1 Tax=Ruegeria arenilitoris TaxID=1173585 RepID=UPI0014813EC0|nr:DUF1127 domain-containing protein [Ruegeria arenilitoris]